MTHWNTGRKPSRETVEKMKASWTPERRAAQAERARNITDEDRRKGLWKVAEHARRLESREAARQRALKAYHDHKVGQRIREYWTPERRRQEAILTRQRWKQRGYLVAWHYGGIQ